MSSRVACLFCATDEERKLNPVWLHSPSSSGSLNTYPLTPGWDSPLKTNRYNNSSIPTAITLLSTGKRGWLPIMSMLLKDDLWWFLLCCCSCWNNLLMYIGCEAMLGILCAYLCLFSLWTILLITLMSGSIMLIYRGGRVVIIVLFLLLSWWLSLFIDVVLLLYIVLYAARPNFRDK